MRVLLIAELCNPEWVSVPLEGWSHSRAIASIVDGHLVTQVRNREAILRAGLIEGKDFTSINSEAVAAKIYKLATLLRGGAGKGYTTVTGLSALAYPYFEHLIWKQFGDRIRAKEFDIVHRITPLSPTMPSLLAGKCKRAGVPFILGPLNGGVPWPRQFDSARRAEKEWLSYVRDAYKLLPGYHATRRNAAAIIVGSRDTLAQVPKKYQSKCIYIAENAIDPARFTVQRTRTATKPLKLIFIGRLVPYKGADMLVEAVAPLAKAGLVEVDVIGDGPQKQQLVDLIAREGVEQNVRLAGWVEHSKLQHRLADADVFAFPSIREFGGAVALEAMAVGVVPIVVEYGGPAELVTPETGYLVPMGTRAQLIERFRTIIEGLTRDPSPIETKSAAALIRARTLFTWDAKAKQTVEVYKQVLERQKMR